MREFRFRIEHFTVASFTVPIPAHGTFVIDFRDDFEDGLPLHISLRSNEGKVVVNDRTDGLWGEEIVSDFTSLRASESVWVVVAFLGKSARVILNGQTVMRLTGARFDLATISRIRFSEDVPPSEIMLNGQPVTEQFFSRSLEFSQEFMVQGRAFDPARLGKRLALRVEGLESHLECWRTPEELQVEGLSIETATVTAPLPGYVWLRASEDPARPLIVQVYSDDRPYSEKLEIQREDVVRRLDQLAEMSHPDERIYPALTAVEHVKFANLRPLLSPRSLAYIRRTVEVFSLVDFFDPGEDPATIRTAHSVEAETPSYLTVMQKRFANSIQLKPTASIASHLSLVGGPLVGASQSWGQFLISISEYCCVKGEFDALFQRWTQNSSAESLPKPTNNWMRSQLLPFYLRLGQFAEVAKLLRGLSEHPDDWANTGCVAWTIEQCLSDWQMTIGSEALSAIIDAFVELITAHAKGYWTRSPCLNLVKASALLVIHRDQLPEPRPSKIIRSTVQNYGLSRDFWAVLQTALVDRQQSITDLGPEIAAAYDAFKTVCAYIESAPASASPSRSETEAALRFFRHMGNHEAGRVRMETFGPANLVGNCDVGVRSLIEEGDEGPEILLRHLAFPGSRHLPTTLSDYARDAVRQRLRGIGQTNHHKSIEKISAECNSLCRTVQSGAVTGSETEQLENIIRRIQRLPVSPENRLDLGIGLALCGDFVRDGRSDLADVASTFLHREIEALSDKNKKALRSNRMFRGTLSRFHMLAVASALPLPLALDRLIRERIKPALQHPTEPDPAMTDLWRNSRGLFDTLVLVYSCRQNLETKVAQARRTWLMRLQEYGIPYLIVVGDGTGAVDGDVLAVDAPDTYEALPRKTLAMLAWAEKHTHFAHVLKIDDDCFLGIEEYFFSLSHRQNNYYGRQLNREVGSKPRMWHMARSATLQGQNELDKSPEPSRFADGGSAYALSREALVAIRTALDTTTGQRLVSCSFSEDKLVGDLLNTVGIQPKSEDYFTAVRRPTRPGGHPVLQWENTFYPSVMSGIKLAHLDTYPDLETCAELYKKGTLNPKKVWPTHSSLALRNSSQTMELISPEARLHEARQADIAVGAVVRNEMFMLPHFLRHYRELGVSAFLIVDNCSDDGTLEYLMEQPDVTVFSADGSFRHATQGTDWKIALCAQFRFGKWTLIVDTDELVVYPGYETRSLVDYVNDPIHGDADGFLTSMIDMFPQGSLSDATFTKAGPFIESGYAERAALLETSLSLGSFGNRPARTSSLRHRLIPGSRPELFVSEKVALVKYKPWMRFSVSMHYAAGVRLADQNVILAHFKYNSEFRAKAIREIKRGQYFNNSEEYKKYVDLISEGRDTIYDPETSVPWRDCREVRAVLDR
ncbi:MAG: glycosyltransferase family 2 protein [Rhodobacteraceae bacterium]|nr:glycosyltransferase family 2 protein [Paracoccaceae bacterium]